MNAQSAISRAIAEKRRLMFERHGGIMSSTDVAREVGYCPRASSGDRWAAEHDIPASGAMRQIWWQRPSCRGGEWYERDPK